MKSFSSFILTEGGIGGHIPHPFELVSSGGELIDFYKKAVLDIQAGYGMVKFDGVNTALKIVDGKFVMDRGSAKELDVKGIGPDDLENRFGKDHGMVPIGKTVLKMFNDTMDATKTELAAMGLTDDSSLVLNLEYVKGKTNVVKYDGQYIVIHGIKKTSPKNVKNGRVTSRKAEDVEVNPQLLKKYVTKLNSIFKKKYEFRVVSNVESYFEQTPNLKKVLNKQIELNGESDTLSNWLSRYGQYKTPLIPRQKYLDYMDEGKPIPEKDMPDVVIYTASIEMGDEILRNAVNLIQSDDQEGIVITPPEGSQYKITGSFILRGLNSEFQKESLNEVFNTRVDWDRSIIQRSKDSREFVFKRKENSNLMKEWMELHEDFRTARIKFIQAEIEPNNVDSVLTRFKTLSRQQKIKDPNEKNIDWWVKIDPNAKTEEERKELLFQKFMALRDFVTQKEKERTVTQVKNKKIQGQSYKLYEDDTWLVIVPLNRDAACFYGKYTDWCISKPKNMYFNNYTNRDRLMFTILYNKKDPYDNTHYAIGWVVDSESEIEFGGFWDSEDNQYNINDGMKELKLADFPLSIEKIQKILESKLENIIENGWGEVQDDEEYND